VSTFNGLPAHVLMVHFVVVLALLTAVLAIISTVWRSARKRLVWLVLGLASITVVMTPITTNAGEWLEKRVGASTALHSHTELGDTMIYFAAALLVAGLLLVAQHLAETRGKPMKPALRGLIAVVVILAGVASVVQVYRIGDSGAKATWGDQVTASPT
jgi:hypothetical protein